MKDPVSRVPTTFRCPRCDEIFNVRMKCANCDHAMGLHLDRWGDVKYICYGCNRKESPQYIAKTCPTCGTDCRNNGIESEKRVGLFKKEPVTDKVSVLKVWGTP